MSIPKEDKKHEAVIRMKALGISPETIRQFEQEGLVSICEPPMDAFYRAQGEDLEHIRAFEEEHNALVYVVVRSYTTFGKMDTFLFVSDYPDEMENDGCAVQHPEDGVLAYVYNHDAPDCSEFGDVGLKRTPAAGLIRIW